MHLVMLPGFMGTKQDFDEVRQMLPKAFSSVVLPVIPNSEMTCEQSFGEVVVSWYKQNQQAFSRPFALLGYSLGGRVAIALARYLYNKKNCPSYVLIEGAHTGLLSSEAIKERRQRDSRWINAFQNNPLEATLAQWYSQDVFRTLSSVQKRQLIANKSNLNKNEIIAQMTLLSLSRQPDFRPWLNSTSIPFLYITGEYDVKFNSIADKLKRVEHKVAPACGHNVHFENPGWYTKTIQHFIFKLNHKRLNNK